MDASQLLREVGDYCRAAGLAESTFGRLAVNDGKLISRLRDGGRITTTTLDRLRSYIADHPIEANGRSVVRPAKLQPAAPISEHEKGPRRNFRFFDNRQKYLLFVTTCGEKAMVANRVALELGNIRPRPPALRLFDAGVGDGTVLTRVMRAMHARHPTMPFYVVGKEISLEDIRLTLEKLPDRFMEHPASVVVLTNMFYSEAPWLRVRSPQMAASLVWREVGLAGNAGHDFDEQINALFPFLADNWQTRASPSTGNPVYERPVVLVLYREDHKFLLDNVIPRLGEAEADYDLVIASQPYRLRIPAEFKAKRVIGPLARAVGPGGRLIGIHSHGDDPGLEIIRRIWPDEDPYRSDRHELLRAVKQELGNSRRDLNFNAYSDARSIFRYDMHTLPNEVSGPIGTSTLFAAWNAAIYVAQIEDERLDDVVRSGKYLEATAEVLKKHGGLWFLGEILRDLAAASVTAAASASTAGTAAVAPILVEWLRGASIEIAAGKPHAVEALRDHFDPGSEVFINFIPGGDPARIAETATAVRRAGFRPVPHIAARSLESQAALEAFVGRATGEAGVERVLVIAGDRDQPRGPFASAADVLASGLIERSGIRAVGFAGHPEGSRAIAPEALLPLLAGKITAARSRGLDAFIVTQFAFEAAPVLAWLAALRRAGIDAPVRLGIAGPATLATLLRFALACGIGNSLRVLRNRPNLVGRLLGVATPDELLRDLASGLGPGMAGLHLYPFGGVERTGAWITETLTRLYAEMG